MKSEIRREGKVGLCFTVKNALQNRRLQSIFSVYTEGSSFPKN